MRQIAEALRDRGLRVWLDEWELVPGRPWQEALEEIIQTTRSSAVLVGKDGLGPWEIPEMRASLAEFVRRKSPVIPVLLPDAPEKPELPLFLQAFTWVDLRRGLTPEQIDRLIWGITGVKPKPTPAPPPSGPRLHNLPFLSIGDLLKGRDDDLQSLAASLQKSTHATAIVQPHAIHGLGGIGKTRLAVEYAWRSGDRHHAALFVRANSPEALHAGLAGLADPLSLDPGLPQEEITRAVFGWLQEHPGWLLILDNVDTEEAEHAVLGILHHLTKGHVLITSRRANWPPEVRERPIEKLSHEEAIQYLLDRTGQKRASGPDDAEKAGELGMLLDGLPLALEQAAAYINHRRISFSKYLENWQRKREEVLGWYDASQMRYPAPVAVTWQSTFDQLSLTAKSILRLSAYLAPDPIPVEMFEKGEEILKEADARLCDQMGEEIESTTVNDALGDLAAYSMATFNDGMFTVHRMVQEVIRTRIPEEQRRDWIELSLRLVNDFSPPAPGDVRSWPIWDVLRPHVAEVVEQADRVGLSDPTARLMNELEQLLKAKGLYAEAEPLMRRALTIAQGLFGIDAPEVTPYLNNLAQLLKATNRLSEAEPLMRRALDIDKNAFGENHPEVAIDLNNLAGLLQATNRLSEAEPLMRRALDIDKNAFGENHPNVAVHLNNLAQLLQATNRLSEAEPLMRRALDIDKNAFGENHPKVAIRLNNLAQLLQATNRLSEAEPLMRRALDIDQNAFGENHPNVAVDLNNLAQLLQATNRLSEAEPLMRGALDIDQNSFGENHPTVAIDLNNLATLLQATNRLSEAEPLMRRALDIDKNAFGENHPNVARNLNNLASLLHDTNRLSEAEPLMRRALEIFEQSLGPDHPKTGIARRNLERLLQKIAEQGNPPALTPSDA